MHTHVSWCINNAVCKRQDGQCIVHMKRGHTSHGPRADIASVLAHGGFVKAAAHVVLAAPLANGDFLLRLGRPIGAHRQEVGSNDKQRVPCATVT